MDERDDHITKTIKNLLDRKLSGRQLWDVLSALRGPDDQLQDVKDATTNIIRYTLGFRMKPWPCPEVDNESQHVFDSSPDSEECLQIRLGLGNFSHFVNHVAKAFEVLGLKWDEVNR